MNDEPLGPTINLPEWRRAVRAGRIEWRRHALERMLERGVSRTEVKAVLLKGEPIEEYPGAAPLPAALFLGQGTSRPLHVVAAFDGAAKTVCIITVYEPDREYFEPDFRTRRKWRKR